MRLIAFGICRNSARQMLRNIFELCATAAGIIWLEPAAAPFVVLTLAAALVPTFTTQSILAERDLRVRSHAAGLTRFYLDAMLGLLSIRAHSAERSVRREHEKLLGEWAHAALRLQKAVAVLEAVQITAMFALVAALVLLHPLQGANIGRVLLVVYWALNLPVLGQEMAALSRQYPYYRNLTLRLLDPLGAPEEPASRPDGEPVVPVRTAPAIEFRDVAVEASGHKILEGIDVRIEPGSQVAIVGPSGAGKSSLVGVLLGWLKPGRGEVSGEWRAARLWCAAPLDRLGGPGGAVVEPLLALQSVLWLRARTARCRKRHRCSAASSLCSNRFRRVCKPNWAKEAALFRAAKASACGWAVRCFAKMPG